MAPRPQSLNHHLWNNHGTLHLPDYTTRRLRFNLRTRDLAEARARRDQLLARFGACTAQAA